MDKGYTTVNNRVKYGKIKQPKHSKSCRQNRHSLVKTLPQRSKSPSASCDSNVVVV